MEILKIEIFGADIQIRYSDGSREEIDTGIYERKDTDGDTVEERLATAADIARLSALAADYEAEIVPLSAMVTSIQVVGTSIEIRYDNGMKEKISGGVYEIKDASNDTIFERSATSSDSDRLFALEVGETGAGDPSTSGPIIFDGTAGDDRMEGSGTDDEMSGGAGDDRMRARGGDDNVNGDDGNDRVRGDGGNDTVSGGSGNDRVRGDGGDDTVSGNDGNDIVKGDAGNDIVSGGNGDDIVKGGRGDDTLSGDAGNDKVNGDEGNDIVSGGDGDDLVKGGLGDDVINGDDGVDKYDGGLGADTFVFDIDGAFDRIKDFEDGIDLIDISAFAVANAAALSMSQVNQNVLIDLGGGDVIRVDNTTLSQIDDSDFIF